MSTTVKISHLSKELQDQIKKELSIKDTSIQETVKDTSVADSDDVKKMRTIKAEIKSLEEKVFDLKVAAKQVNKITSEIKYDETVNSILTRVKTIADSSSIDKDDYKYAEEEVDTAKSSLESAIFSLDELFKDAISSTESKISDLEYDLEDLKEASE